MAGATDFQKTYLEHQKQLQRDIRPMIARSGQYNPEGDVSAEYQHYPRWIDLPDGTKVVVKTEEEEHAKLGITTKPAKAVDVNVTDLSHLLKPTEVHVKRKYTKKAAPVALPADLK